MYGKMLQVEGELISKRTKEDNVRDLLVQTK